MTVENPNEHDEEHFEYGQRILSQGIYALWISGADMEVIVQEVAEALTAHVGQKIEITDIEVIVLEPPEDEATGEA